MTGNPIGRNVLDTEVAIIGAAVELVKCWRQHGKNRRRPKEWELEKALMNAGLIPKQT